MNSLSKKLIPNNLSIHFKILFPLFLIIQLFLYLKIGVFIDLEAKKYILQGEYFLANGQLTNNKYFFYLPVILLITLCKLLNFSYLFIVLFQVALSGFSLFCFYKLTNQLTNKTVALWSSILLCLFIPLQMWNFYLYSDSIFISLTIIFSYLIATNEKRGIIGIIMAIIFLIILIFSRPNGVLFIPVVIAFLILKKTKNLSIKIFHILISLSLLVVFFFISNRILIDGEELDVLKPFKEEHIICFVPLKPEGANINIINTNNPAYNLYYYIIHNPGHFLRLSFLKMESFFNLTRSYYSNTHNTILSIFLIPIYIFIIPGIIFLLKLKLNNSIYIISLLIIYPLCFIFLCDDWHSRFAMIVFPYIILISCFGFYSILNKYTKAE